MTTFEFTLPNDECAITIAKTQTMVIDMDQLTDTVKGFIFTYGIRQLLNDAGAGKPDKFGAAELKRERLYAGEIERAARAGQTPLAREMERLATEVVNKAIRTKFKTLKAYLALDEGNAAKHEAAIARYVETNADTLRVEAQAILDAAKAAGESVDLTDLGL